MEFVFRSSWETDVGGVSHQSSQHTRNKKPSASAHHHTAAHDQPGTSRKLRRAIS
jgi:hypothetical protein